MRGQFVLCAAFCICRLAVAFLPLPAGSLSQTRASIAQSAAADAQQSNLAKAPAADLAVSLPPIPKLITFDAEGTLLQLASPRGLLLRECLLKAHGYLVRLPGPDVFQKAYDEAFAAACASRPCFGCGAGVPSHEWWFDVTRETMIKVCERHNFPVSGVLDPVLDDLFDDLYYEVFAGPEAWELIPDAARTLDRLAAWRDTGGGPLLGIIANADERLPTVLDNLGILPYFDFVVTSRQIGTELPGRALFDVALDKACLSSSREALHCGGDFYTDIEAASTAGWQSCLIANPDPTLPKDGPQTLTLMSVSGLLPALGLQPLGGPILTTRRRGQFVDGEL